MQALSYMMRVALVVSFVIALGSVAWLVTCYGYLVHDDYFHKYLLNARGLWGTVAYLFDGWDGRVITPTYLLTLALLDLFSVSAKMLFLNVIAFTVQCVLIYWLFLRKHPPLAELAPLEGASLLWAVLFVGTIVYVAQIFNWYIILYYILVNMQVIWGAFLLERQRWRQLFLFSPLIFLTFQHALVALMGMGIYWAINTLSRKEYRHAVYYLLVAFISLTIASAMTFLTGSSVRFHAITPSTMNLWSRTCWHFSLLPSPTLCFSQNSTHPC